MHCTTNTWTSQQQQTTGRNMDMYIQEPIQQTDTYIPQYSNAQTLNGQNQPSDGRSTAVTVNTQPTMSISTPNLDSTTPPNYPPNNE